MMNVPSGVFATGKVLFVAEAGNSRVVIFNGT
jgi:hypothetical protein